MPGKLELSAEGLGKNGFGAPHSGRIWILPPFLAPGFEKWGQRMWARPKKFTENPLRLIIDGFHSKGTSQFEFESIGPFGPYTPDCSPGSRSGELSTAPDVTTFPDGCAVSSTSGQVLFFLIVLLLFFFIAPHQKEKTPSWGGGGSKVFGPHFSNFFGEADSPARGKITKFAPASKYATRDSISPGP